MMEEAISGLLMPIDRAKWVQHSGINGVGAAIFPISLRRFVQLAVSGAALISYYPVDCKQHHEVV